LISKTARGLSAPFLFGGGLLGRLHRLRQRHYAAGSMSAFDPPAYIGKLISAINDGAKSAQLGAVAFVFIGLFLLATSFSATDEDLLIGKSISISQLGGVTVPVVLSFGFMPAIFLALHLYTLIRFDLLMQNLRHFEAELRAHVPLQRDRDRCLQLLANTEFIQAAVQPEASFVFRWTYRFMLAVFPVAVLLLVQLGSLRLQSDVVNIVHHITILLDILLLIWFFRRQRPSEDSVLLWLLRHGRYVLPAAVLGFNFAWWQVPSAEETTVGVVAQNSSVGDPLRHPVDLLLCPHVGLGCRYLSVPGRTLVGKVWDNGTFVQSRAGEALDEKRRAHVHLPRCADDCGSGLPGCNRDQLVCAGRPRRHARGCGDAHSRSLHHRHQ
jgi:hypothetical protein